MLDTVSDIKLRVGCGIASLLDKTYQTLLSGFKYGCPIYHQLLSRAHKLFLCITQQFINVFRDWFIGKINSFHFDIVNPQSVSFDNSI
jgi:hypothetical protein